MKVINDNKQTACTRFVIEHSSGFFFGKERKGYWKVARHESEAKKFKTKKEAEAYIENRIPRAYHSFIKITGYCGSPS